MASVRPALELGGSEEIRNDWLKDEVESIFSLPFNDLIYIAHSVHRRYFDHNEVQLSTLLNIKSGGCPEDCSYCPQSVHYKTGVKPSQVLSLEDVMDAAKAAKKAGATRFCMGAAWRSPKSKDIDNVVRLIEGVKTLGLETCVTLGMLDQEKTSRLAKAGLDYYNHNLDTSPEYYGEIISTRTYEDRLTTLQHVRNHEIKVCCGGIVGLGESTTDRVGLLHSLATLSEHPESVPINLLIRVEGTPLEAAESVPPIEFARVVATARILMPKSMVRLSAGRTQMTDELQALCFFAGANSIFYGDSLLTTANPQVVKDEKLFSSLGLGSRKV
jgi:biotin synthase